MKREDYLPEDCLSLPASWILEGRPDFLECPNNSDKVWVLSSGGYVLKDRREEDKGVGVSDTCTCACDKESSVMKDWVINHTVLSEPESLQGIIVLNGVNCAQFERLKREIETALESKSFEDGLLLILHEVPEVLYIPIGGANDQASS